MAVSTGISRYFLNQGPYIRRQPASKKMSRFLKPSCARVFVPLLTLGFPLGVVLVVVLRLPIEELNLASTDMRLLQGFSTFWCGWQEVTSTHSFYAYKVPEDPDVGYNDKNINTFAFRFTLRKGHFHIFRYHLLPGSSIDTSGCASAGPVLLDVVYGDDNFEHCWKNNPPNDDSDEEFDNASSSEEDDSFETERTYRRVQRRLSNTKCPSPLSSSHLDIVNDISEKPSPMCDSRFEPAKSVNVTRSGIYYVMVRSDYNSNNSILLYIKLNRTSYALPDNMILCRSQSSCEIPLTFGTSERVVVFMSYEPDGGSVVFPVRSKCKPRIVFYLVVFLMLPIMFAVALAFAIRTSRGIRLAAERSRFNELASRCSVATVPLLNDSERSCRANKPGHDLEASMIGNNPPPYIFVAELPPSYEAALALATASAPDLPPTSETGLDSRINRNQVSSINT